ncbi:MAG: DUF502 domain-containing protein [Firmicutes bacterium]|nr:DUF502 domain-containing protein [Bacillota bacterium]
MRRYFINGLLVLLPGVVTVYVLVFGLSTIDSIFGSVIKTLVGYHIPGAGTILTILLIIGTGMFATNVIGKRIIQLGERIFLKIPVLSNIYQGVRQAVSAFSRSSDKHQFQRVVLVEYPRRGLYSMGFVTSEGIPEINESIQEDAITVFVPTTPNPTSGFFLVVPAQDCLPLNISIEDAFKTVISGGIIGPNGKTSQS